MKYLSIDIETTGLDPETDQILQVSAVFEDTAVDPLPAVAELPYFNCIIKHDRIYGNPFALKMNADLIEVIASNPQLGLPTKYHGSEVSVANPWAWPISFREWLYRCHLTCDHPPIVVAGKNAAGFDLPFIKARAPNLGDLFHHHVIDVGSVAMGKFPEEWDKRSVLPGLADVLEMVGLPSVVTHDALDDARVVVAALRRLW